MEKEELNITINTSNLKKSFLNHLDLENNSRILFSGPYGTGKSTFLNEIEKENSENYFFIKLNPVNYSISANEDVFELIKFDILLQLVGKFSKECDLSKDDFTIMLKSQMFIMEHLKFMPLLNTILGLSEKIGTPVIDFLKAINETVENYKKFSDEIKIDENKDIESFLLSIENKLGSQHEMNAISELIKDLINRVQINKNNAKSILIIDDLDRLDPEHIFRLFNIFSAHYDSFDNSNKFGFDKVIFVCDVINIKNLFHHKYGRNVDFSGYIDKFYSSFPFHFDNIENIILQLDNFLMLNNFDDEFGYSYYYKFEMKGFNVLLKSILKAFVLSKEINLRDLLSVKFINIPDNKYRLKGQDYAYDIKQTPFLILMYVVKSYFSDLESVENAFENLLNKLKIELFNTFNNLQSSINQAETINTLMSICIPFLIENNKVVNSRGEIKHFNLKEENVFIHFIRFENSGINLLKFEKATIDRNIDGDEVSLNPYSILNLTLKKCIKLKLIK